MFFLDFKFISLNIISPDKSHTECDSKLSLKGRLSYPTNKNTNKINKQIKYKCINLIRLPILSLIIVK